MMSLSDSEAFSGFSVDDLGKAKAFYGDVLGLKVSEGMDGTLELDLAGGGKVFLYQKPNHAPATYTVLNFPVEDVDAAVNELSSRGVRFERYDQPGIKNGREGDPPRRRPRHRLVQGPGGQHPLGPERKLTFTRRVNVNSQGLTSQTATPNVPPL